MKKLTVILAAVLFTSTLFAQEKKDTTTFKIGKSTIIIISDKDALVKIENGDTINSDDNDSCKKNKFDGHWGGFDIGLNRDFYGILLPSNSDSPL